MQEDSVADVKMEGEDGGLSYKRKYKEMKQRVKYLAYEHECFQHDLQKAQEKLLLLAKDKSCLLDQLLRYETVMLSDDDEQTDYSTEEDEEVDTPFFNPQRTELNSKSLHSNQKASPKSSQPKQGAGKPSLAASPKPVDTPKSGARRQQQKGSGVAAPGSLLTTAAKIAKTVAKAHTTTAPKPTPPQQQQPQPPQPPGSLVVSLPLVQLVPKVKQLPAAGPTPLLVATASTATTQQLPSDLAMPPPPPLTSHGPADAPKRTSSSSSSSSTSGSDSSSESSSSSDEGNEQPSGPVPMMSAVHSNMAVKGVSQLVRPKALTSPSNPPPPKLIFVGDGPVPAPPLHPTSPPPLQQSQLAQPQQQQQPGVFTWSNRQQLQESSPAGGGPPGFTPIVPTLSSPTFNKPSPGSAFHVVSPKYDSKPSSIAL